MLFRMVGSASIVPGQEEPAFGERWRWCHTKGSPGTRAEIYVRDLFLVFHAGVENFSVSRISFTDCPISDLLACPVEWRVGPYTLALYS